ncbi:hypothetical protein [Clostridium aciditolerans]|uniref:Uncharacterized protein n=1 Tax=Clostridium aciditolerans TaxID=339861 RepID=A0A934HXG7_9CLOT|nr:hypothetical protein [Clostridium aciditolerans]MBI6873054.1 hypothetical protein [Clostridium aciditolerans]
MFKNTIYKPIMVILCLILFVFLIVMNFNVRQKIAENEAKLRVINENKSDDSKLKQFGFTEILEGLSEKEKVKINGLRSQSNKEAAVELEILGDISVVKSTLEDIKNKDNYQRINNIKINKDENSNNTTKVNIDFIKNK